MGFQIKKKIVQNQSFQDNNVEISYLEPTNKSVAWFDKSDLTIKLFNEELGKWVNISSQSQQEVSIDMPKLIEVNHELFIQSFSSTKISLPIGINRYDIRTVEAKGNNNQDISLIINESSSGGKIIYKSIDSKSIYDVCNIPCEDKDKTEMIHLEIFNKSIFDADISITIKLTSLL